MKLTAKNKNKHTMGKQMKSNKLNRSVMAMAAATSMIASSQGLAAVVPPSDRLIVNYGGVTADKTILETKPEDYIEVNNGGQPWLPRNGYVAIYEPDGKTLSDILVSYTGSSLQFYSDGYPQFPTIQSLKDAGVPELGNYNETANGIDINVGHLFGTTAMPVPANAIRLISDGDPVVPEPSTYFAGLSALGMLGLFGLRNRK